MSRVELLERKLRTMTPQQRANLALLATPRIVEPYIRHIPHPTQQVFLSLNSHKEVFFGGAGGGGKSDALLMAALQYVDVPGYAALILRKTWPDLVLPGAIMDRARDWLMDTPATPRDGGRLWVFPSGARLQFGYLQHDNDKYRYRSAEFQYIAFDELTMWPEEQTYDYLFSRLRKPAVSCLNCGTTLHRYRDPQGDVKYSHKSRKAREKCNKVFPDPKVLHQYPPSPDGLTIFDVPLRMRSASNPGGPGHEWVKARFIDPRTKRPDVLFIPSKLSDNPSLDEETYNESLEHLNEVDKARMRDGDWDAVQHGDWFDRGDFVYVDKPPANIIRWVRFWDTAASQDQGDYTVGCLMGLTDDNYVCIADVVRFRLHPHEAEKRMFATARMDGLDVDIREEQEPGASGVKVIEHMRRNVFPGFNYDGVRSSGSKEARAKAFSSYVKGKKVMVVVGQWNRDFMNELEQFPNGAHDDQVDAAAGAFNELMFGTYGRLIV